MGYGDHSDLHDHGPHGFHQPGSFDPTQRSTQQAITDYINRRLGSTQGERSDHKDIAREVSSLFGVLLTPSEVKDIHHSGW